MYFVYMYLWDTQKRELFEIGTVMSNEQVKYIKDRMTKGKKVTYYRYLDEWCEVRSMWVTEMKKVI